MKKTVMFFTLVIFLAVNIFAIQPQKIKNSAEIELALKKLQVLGSALYIGAHPDDENTALLAYLTNERLLRAAYLSLTRGDGGQNLIGTEKGALLGILRTQELLAARRIDGAEQFFTRAVDFGYSKNPEETLAIWDKEKILADIVWVIRKFHPDIIITRFTPELGGHGHHRASAMLALEAFQAAGDSRRFPEQLRYVKPWQSRRIVWNAWQPALEREGEDVSRLIKVDLGTFNPLLGQSYMEIAARSRSMHKSQGFGTSARRGSYPDYFKHLAGESAQKDLWEDIDLSWSRIPNGESVGKILNEAYKNFNPENPAEILPLLMKAYKQLLKLSPSYWKKIKQQELLEVIQSCAGIWIEAIAEDYAIAPGQLLRVKAQIINRSSYPFFLQAVTFLPDGATIPIGKNLENNQPVYIDTLLLIPSNTPYSQPYWLKRPSNEGTFQIAELPLIGLPIKEPPFKARFTLQSEDLSLSFETPLQYRWTDPVAGEQYRPLEIFPEITINLEEKVLIFPDNRPKAIRVSVKSSMAGVAGNLRLVLSPGWRVTPSEAPFILKHKNDELTFAFKIHPPDRPYIGRLKAVATVNNKELSYGLVIIKHPHIPIQTVFPPAEAKLVRVDLNASGKRLGYIMGAGDEIPDFLRQLGYEVQMLSDEKLETLDLSQFDAIIAGVRAYNTRPILKHVQKRLTDYVYSGGTYIVQYNTLRNLVTESLGPYPFKISRERVSVESAPVRFLSPNHPLLNFPNKITLDDFKDWVQERGLYFANPWDGRYQTLLSSHDPGEPPGDGGLLFARYGKGIYIYTGYAWFRQLPAGIPGAFRFFINMISAGAFDESTKH